MLLCSCEPSASRHASLATEAAERGDIARAIQHLDEAIRLDPDSLEYHEERAARLVWSGRYEEAQRDFVIACTTKEKKQFLPLHEGYQRRPLRSLRAGTH